MIYNTALDIDQVLAFHKVKDKAQGQFFFKNGAVLTAMRKTHYIFPGIIEFIRLLFSTPNIRTSFYSAGHRIRNQELIPIILDGSVPEVEFDKKKSEVRVLSREDLISCMKEDIISKHYYPHFDCISYQQKDLNNVLFEGDLIENAALIDDQAGNAANGQLYNFLRVPVSEAHAYDSLIEKMKFYDPASGTRFLKCLMTTKETVQDNFIKEGNRIGISKNSDWFEVKFLNLEGNIQVEIVDLEDEELYEQLDYFYERALKSGHPLGYIGESNVVENICNFVSENNGKSRKICRRANRICYVAGVLFEALNLAETKKISLSDALRSLQFKWNEDNQIYEPNFHKLQKNDLYYQIGLAKLREINPNYAFITPHSYFTATQIPLSDEMNLFLQNAISNEFTV
jgi:hypothetical protein